MLNGSCTYPCKVHNIWQPHIAAQHAVEGHGCPNKDQARRLQAAAIISTIPGKSATLPKTQNTGRDILSGGPGLAFQTTNQGLTRLPRHLCDRLCWANLARLNGPPDWRHQFSLCGHCAGTGYRRIDPELASLSQLSQSGFGKRDYSVAATVSYECIRPVAC